MKILKFSASWCSPCKILDYILKDYDKYPIEKLSIEDNPDKILEYNVMKVPTLIVLNDKEEELSRISGMISRESFEKWIEEVEDGKQY